MANWKKFRDIKHNYNISENTLRTWVKRNKIRHETKDNILYVDIDDVEAYLGKKQKERRKPRVDSKKFSKEVKAIKAIEESNKIKLQEIKEGHVTLEQLENRIEATQDISKAEAERLIKIEEAIKKRRENLYEQKEYIRVSEIEEDIIIIQKVLINDLKELIEKWAIDLHLQSKKAEDLKKNFEKQIQKSFKKMSKTIEK